MPRIVSLLALLFLAMFVFVEVASAKLLRSTGRGVLSEQFSEDYFFVENKDIVRFLDGSFGMSQSGFDNRFSLSNSIGGGGRGISAVPTNGPTATNCNGSYDDFELQDALNDLSSAESSDDQTDIDRATAALEQLENGDPCVYQFEQGEDLLAFGSFSMFFDTPSITTLIEWNIEGKDPITGSVNTGGDITTPDGTIANGNVVLDAPAPANLAVGVYDLKVRAILSSDLGEFFMVRESEPQSSTQSITLQLTEEANPAYIVWQDAFEQWLQDVYDPWLDNNRTGPEPVFGLTEPDVFISGYQSVSESGFVTTAPRSFFSLTETLQIIAASTDPEINPVNAPLTSGLMLFAFIGLWIRKRA